MHNGVLLESPAIRPFRGLTPRQEEVLRLLANKLTNAEIAAELGISFDGAKWHVGEVLARLNLESRTEAARWWRSAGRARTAEPIAA